MIIADYGDAGGLKPVKLPAQKPIQPSQANKITAPQRSIDGGDRAELSSAARDEARALQVAKLVYDALPPVRKEKIELAKKRLAEGIYDRPEIIRELATKLMADPGLRPPPPLPEKVIEDLRQKIKTGFYDRPEVRDVIAQRIEDELKVE